MRSPFFSIIIPTYNSAQTLQVCLDSLLVQSFQQIEVLLVDGGSVDDTISIIKQYEPLFSARLTYLSEKDNGIYDAMNKGIKMARGEWIIFLGSDDKLHHPMVLQTVFDLDKSGYEVVYGNAQVMGNTSWAKDGDIYDGPFDLVKLLQKNICHQAIFYNRSCFKTDPPFFKPQYKLCADWDFNFRCWAKAPFLFIDLIIADFYSGGETTKTNIDTAFTNSFKSNLLAYFGNNKTVDELVNRQPVATSYLNIHRYSNFLKNIFNK